MRDLQTSGSIRARGFTRRWAIRFGRSSFLLLFLLLGPALSFVVAAPGHKSKMAPDLEEETRKGSPSRSVRLVATLEGDDADAVARKVAELGGIVRGHFHQVQVMALELPLESVEELAATDGVRYLAPDREVSALASQLDTTTGADLVYSGRLSPGGYEGTGAADIVVTLSEAKRIVAGAVSFFNVDQTTPHGLFASAAGPGSTAWVKVASATGEIVINAVTANGDAGPLTVGGEQMEGWNAF